MITSDCEGWKRCSLLYLVVMYYPLVQSVHKRSRGKRMVQMWDAWSCGCVVDVLHCHVVSLDKKLCSALSLFTQVFKWVPVTYYWA